MTPPHKPNVQPIRVSETQLRDIGTKMETKLAAIKIGNAPINFDGRRAVLLVSSEKHGATSLDNELVELLRLTAETWLKDNQMIASATYEGAALKTPLNDSIVRLFATGHDTAKAYQKFSADLTKFADLPKNQANEVTRRIMMAVTTSFNEAMGIGR